MSDVWETKYGLRRVRRDPPTVDDAVLAAQGLAEDLEGQIEIVVALMSVPAEEARRAVLKMRRPDSRLTVPGRGGATRAVLVERKSPRRVRIEPKASVGRRGLG
jgi:2-phospho-L-lactate guanylyltransferase (CobY/MobA/RfbA family)